MLNLFSFSEICQSDTVERNTANPSRLVSVQEGEAVGPRLGFWAFSGSASVLQEWEIEGAQGLMAVLLGIKECVFSPSGGSGLLKGSSPGTSADDSFLAEETFSGVTFPGDEASFTLALMFQPTCT